MKKHYLILKPILILLLVILTKVASAQVTAGPSDILTAAPTSAAGADKILCFGTAISLTGPPDAGGDTYHWYKNFSGGPQQTDVNQTGRTYSEASGAAGWYYYQLVVENVNHCLSPISNPVKVYVLPELTVTLNSPSNFCADGTTTALLTATVPAAASTIGLTYAWTKTSGGLTTTVGTSNTYTVPAQSTAGTSTYTVSVTYTLNNGCLVTAFKTITVYALPGQPSITAN
ncbi:hypothetical protein [Mucilaginibacter sp.]|uniref:Ig-like domain-containing protein n=1 Tax=Mucilaginibacter sp. TaxID=1882438 RepID=UPI00260F02E3|nr:hypothetical protein [Mucilaginibacter sp.]MDB5031594.1 repeat protein [Mucilaginibacter sp.]